MTSTPEGAVERLHESAARFNIELDEAETQRWLDAMTTSAPETGEDAIVVDEKSGVFGHRVSMLDFSTDDLARFREIGRIVQLTGPEDVTEGALALSGSAAQSKIQTHPGDADFFQRFNIKAATREDACTMLAGLMKDKAEQFATGPTYQFIEAKWSSYPFDCVRHGDRQGKGGPISWKLEDIQAGFIDVEVDGATKRLDWNELADEPGWCKLDWVVVDPKAQRLTNASNVIDVTWEAPNGDIVALDGYLDGYFQEVYLDSGALPMFEKVVSHVSGDALDDYIEQLEGEVRKYLTEHPNYGKAAKRMYNVFRLTGRTLDAAFVRELFDEPTTMLYKVWALIGSIDNAVQPDSTISVETVRAQADDLIMTVVEALEGTQEKEVVAALLALRTSLDSAEDLREAIPAAQVEGAKVQVVNLINTFFHDRLASMPTIKEYMDSFGPAGSAGH